MKVFQFLDEREIKRVHFFKSEKENTKKAWGAKDAISDELLFWCGVKLTAHVSAMKAQGADGKAILAYVEQCRIELQPGRDGKPGQWVAMMPAEDGGFDVDRG